MSVAPFNTIGADLMSVDPSAEIKIDHDSTWNRLSLERKQVIASSLAESAVNVLNLLKPERRQHFKLINFATAIVGSYAAFRLSCNTDDNMLHDDDDDNDVLGVDHGEGTSIQFSFFCLLTFVFAYAQIHV